MAHDVFLSYSSKDKPTADAVCNGLESAGIRCWMAPRDILPGQQWASAIVEAIHASRLMVVVLSTNSNVSEQVLREVERSVHRAVPIIPFRIEEFELASALEYYLSVPHWLDAMTGPLEDHIVRLVQTARVLLEQRPRAAEPASGATAGGSAAAEQASEDAELAALMRPRPPDLAASSPVAAATVPAQASTAAPVAALPTAQPIAPRPVADIGGQPKPTQRPPWLWAIPAAVVVLAAALFVVIRLLGAPSERGGTGDPTAGPLAQATSAIPAGGPSANQPPQAAPGSVNVTSSVPGATILVDGQRVGQTPQTLSLQPGQYKVTLQAASYRDWSQDVEVSEREQVRVQGILEELPVRDIVEVSDRIMGRNAVVDREGIIRIQEPTDTFRVSDVVNAVVYFSSKAYLVRDLAPNVTNRWQIAGEGQPGVVSGATHWPRDAKLPLTHACALASQLDPRGSNTPLTLEVQVDGETVARFTFRISGGNLADAPSDPVQACDRTKLPNVVVTAPEALTAGDVL